MSNAFNIGKLFGIQFRLHYTWFIIFILVTVSFVYPDWSSLLYWAIGITTSLLFFASILAHELAHSLVGRANDVPIISITLFIFGGVAQMTREARSAKAELKMAVAGPACSLVIAGLFYIISLLTENTFVPLANMAFQLAFINTALAVFNLVPGFPLDGGRVFRSILWQVTGNYQRSTKIATQVGRGIGFLFIIAGILIILLRPFNLNWFTGLWLAFIGWFIENAASATYRQSQFHEALQGFTASQVMTTDYQTIPANITINQLVQGYIFTSSQGYFLVADEGTIIGALTISNIKAVSQANWATMQVKDIMTPMSNVKIAYPDQNVLSILEQMTENNVNQMPVFSNGKVIGLITRSNLIRLLQIRSQLRI
ncbi:MAG: site-2 protease family protein [Dehalococcoidales bacterium]|nr:site-2 protease family protein [Dehalococcoidales bacterium]